MRYIRPLCAIVACLVMVIGCGGGGTSTGDRPTEEIPVSVQLFDSTQDAAQGKTVIFDYSGPELNEEDLTVRVGDTEVPALLSETQIYIVLPLSESGETTVAFEFPGDKVASVQLNIAEAPAIEDPEAYASDQIAEVVSLFESLRDEYPDIWEQLDEAESQLAALSEDEAREFAVFFKQNLEPLLGDTETSVEEGSVSEEPPGFAAARTLEGSDNLAVSQLFPELLEQCRIAVRSFIIDQPIVATAIGGLVYSALVPGAQLIAAASFAVVVVKIRDLRNGVETILGGCISKQARILSDGISGVTEPSSQTALFSGSSAAAAARFRPSGVVSQGSEATDRIVFTDGESKTVSVNLDSIIQDDRRSTLLEAYAAFRNLLVNANGKLESLGETLGLELSFKSFIDSFPASLESSEPADTSDFEIEVPSPYLNVEGEITSRERGKLTLLFSFPLGPPVAEDYSDFVFVLTDGDGDPVRVSARLFAAAGVLPYDDLILAAQAGDLDAVNALLEAGADPNQFDFPGFTPLYFAAQNGHTEIVRALLEAGANPNIQTDDGVTPLFKTIQIGGDRHIEIVRALIEAGADLNIQDYNIYAISGRTPLHMAAIEGYTDIARALIEAGADLNIQDDDGWTPLFEAIGAENTEIVRALIDTGADLNIREHNDIESGVVGRAPLHLAATVGDEIVRALINAGADLNVQDGGGSTPLHYAASFGEEDIARALINAGADLNIKEDQYGWTPLHRAAGLGYTEIAKTLINAGADLNVQDDNGWTPLDLAVIGFTETPGPHTSIVNALKARGAACNLTCEEKEDEGEPE